MTTTRRKLEIARVREEGRQAALEGKHIETNPYSAKRSMDWQRWLEGYHWGETERAANEANLRIAQRATQEPAVMYIAVVCKLWERSQKPAGDWASFINKQKAQAISAAVKARREWEAKGYGPYRILVGTVTEEVAVPPVQYKLRPLKEKSRCTCPPYWETQDDGGAEFCPVHGAGPDEGDRENV